MRAFEESNRRAEDAVREVTRQAQIAMEQVQAMATQLQRTWAIVGQEQITRLVPVEPLPVFHIAKAGTAHAR